MVSMPTHRPIEVATLGSLLETQKDMLVRGIPWDFRMPVGSAPVAHMRSCAVAEFLESDSTHLVWIDSDTSWELAEWQRLLALGVVYPVVLGSYVQKKEPMTFAISMHELENAQLNEHGLLPIPGCGLGFSIFQRRVLEAVVEGVPVVYFADMHRSAPYLFSYEPRNGITGTEDAPFWDRCAEVGFPCMLDTMLALKHWGMKAFSGRLRDTFSVDEAREAAE